MAVVVGGCGGDSSSAPAAAGEASAPTGSNVAAPSEGAGAKAAPQATVVGQEAPPKRAQEPAGGSAGKPAHESKLKHPPIELPKGPPEKGPTKAQQERVPTANIVLRLPHGLTKANTCEGADSSPEVRWGEAPAGTAELVVFAASVQPVDGELHFDWAMAGLEPSLEGLGGGEVPKGAVLGRNGDGQNKYSICPAGGAAETYIFSVYPLSQSLSPKPGFDPLALRKEATRLAESVGVEAASYGAG